MRIGVDIRALLDRPLTGVGEYAQQLLTSLMQQTQDDSYVLFSNSYGRKPELPTTWPSGRFTLRWSRVPNKLFNLSLRVFRRPRLDTCVAPVDLFFAPNLHFLPLSPHVPFVVTVHDLSFLHFRNFFSLRRRWWHRFLDLGLLRRADGIIAVSQATADDLHRTLGIPNEKIFVVPSGVAHQVVTVEDRLQVRERFQLPERFLLSLSTLEPRKNLPTVLEAFTLLRRGGEAIDLVIAGAPGWSRKRLERMLLHHPYRSAIHVLPYVSVAEKHALYAQAAVFLYLSFYEGFGFPPLEAALHGTPVLTGHHSSLSEMMGGHAVLVDVYNANDVVSGISALLHDEKLRSQLRAGREALHARYNWERAAAETRQVFHTIVEQYAHRH